jgi:hypothetical protein
MFGPPLEQPERCGEKQSVQRAPIAIDGVSPVASQERLANLHIRDAIDVAHLSSVDPYVREADSERHAPHSDADVPKPIHSLKRYRV